MKEFRKVSEDLAFTDVKPDKGLFTWTNNYVGRGLVRVAPR